MEKIFMCNGKRFSSMENVLDYTDCNKFVITDTSESVVAVKRKKNRLICVNVRSI